MACSARSAIARTGSTASRWLDEETGEPIDLSTLQDIILAIRYPNAGNGVFDGYHYASQGNSYGLNASLKTGEIVIIQPGIFQFWFTSSVMGGLGPQTYDVGLILISQDGVATQLLIGQVPVLEGFARAGVVVT